MSPPGKTSLCAEIPCFPGSEQWDMTVKELIERVSLEFIKLGWIRKKDIIGTEITRLHQAYPVLEKGFEEKIHSLNSFLKSFENLRMTGRNGSFMYSHVHDLLKSGKDVIEELTPIVHSQNDSLPLMSSLG
jgi:protoporphyrinogen oxidase